MNYNEFCLSNCKLFDSKPKYSRIGEHWNGDGFISSHSIWKVSISPLSNVSISYISSTYIVQHAPWYARISMEQPLLCWYFFLAHSALFPNELCWYLQQMNASKENKSTSSYAPCQFVYILLLIRFGLMVFFRLKLHNHTSSLEKCTDCPHL